MDMVGYFLEKLAVANYRIAIHPGAANERLASQVDRILTIPSHTVPEEYRSEFERLLNLINESYGSRRPYKISGIYNKTAAKYIKLLLDIEEALEFQQD